MTLSSFFFFFFFNDPATTEIYTLSLHDALPISSLLQERVPKILPNVQWMDEEQYLSWSFLRFGDVRIGSAPMVGLLDAVGRPTGNYSILKNFLGWERFSSRAGIGGQVHDVH